MGTTYHANDVGSVILGRPAPAPLPSRGGRRGHFKLWSASLRRIVLDAVRCGGQPKHTGKADTLVPEPKIALTTLRSELKKQSNSTTANNANASAVNHNVSGSDKLSDLLKLSEFSEKENEEQEEEEEEEAVRKKVEALEVLKKTVRSLQASSSQHGNDLANVIEGAREIRKLTKDDSKARTTLASLGAIPPLVALLDSPDLSSQIAALYALLNLGIGNDANKAAIVQAGAVHKMLKLIESANGTPDVAVTEPIVANFLALSALDANKPIIGSSGALPFLVRVLQDPHDDTSASQVKQDALRAVYNLSISLLNISHLLDANLVPFLLSKLGDMDMSERILSILSNIVSIAEGRKAISRAPDAFPILVDVLSWTDSPGCQEKVSYILMVMSHKGYGDRQAMVEAGIVSSLLELTLLGSTLAQKRASRILEFITMDKGKQVSESYGGGISPSLSAPLSGIKSSSAGEPTHHHHSLNKQSLEEEEEDQEGMSEERKAVKQLVQQSLQNNMKRMVKRANLPHDFVPSDHFKSLISGSTSKSLPF